MIETANYVFINNNNKQKNIIYTIIYYKRIIKNFRHVRKDSQMTYKASTHLTKLYSCQNSDR